MRIVLVGASSTAVAVAKLLLARNHEVVIVERQKDVIDSLAQTLDCGFLNGDGSRPAILKEAAPGSTDVLICLTDHDQDNILASLVGHSLGFPRIVTKIEEPEYQHICAELGLADTIIPDMNTARTLADLVSGEEATDLSSAIRGEARFFSFVAKKEDECEIAALDLPKDASVVLLYRRDEPVFPQPKTGIRAGDEVVVLTHSRNLKSLEEHWSPLHKSVTGRFQDR